MASQDNAKFIKIGIAVVALLGACGLLAYHFGFFDSDASQAPPAQLTLTPEEQKEKEKADEQIKKLEKVRPSAGS